MESLKSPRAVTILVLVTVFALGLLTGWSLNTCTQNKKLASLTNLDAELNQVLLEKKALRVLEEKFDLNAEQVKNIQPILAAGIAEAVQLRKESLRKISGCRSKYLEQIAHHMNPDQQEKIHQFQRKKDAELQKQLEN